MKFPTICIIFPPHLKYVSALPWETSVISKLGCTDLVFVDPGVKITAHTTTMCSCQSSCYPWCTRYQGNSSSFNRTMSLHTGHGTLCDFSSRQRRHSFRRIFGQRTALTLIRLITGSGVSSSSEPTSRRCTTLTNWNSICSKCVVISTRASLTMQLTSGASIFVHACRRTVDTSSICCRKQYACLRSTVWEHKHFIFVKYKTLFDFSVVICNKFELFNFPKVVREHT